MLMSIPTPRNLVFADYETYRVNGVSVRDYQPIYAGEEIDEGHPILCVHDAFYAGWSWRNYAAWLSERGHRVYAIDLYNHGNSVHLSRNKFLNRGIQAIASDEIRTMMDYIGCDVILMGHGTGALAALLYAQEQPYRVHGVIAISPATPAQVPKTLYSPKLDYSKEYKISYEEARVWFFNTMASYSEWEARRAFSLLEPESPRLIHEATTSTVWLQGDFLHDVPSVIISADEDELYETSEHEKLARIIRASHATPVYGLGHSDILLRRFNDSPSWRDGVATVGWWITENFTE